MSLYLKLQHKAAHPPISPEMLVEEAVAFFQWCEENPMKEEIVSIHRGMVSRAEIRKQRPFTKQGLAAFLGISVYKLDSLKKLTEWKEAFALIEQVIYEQKFSGAAVGIFNANLISRDLGLAEKSEVGGLANAPPLVLNVTPISAGTFLPTE